jgi:hypothetical protein
VIERRAYLMNWERELFRLMRRKANSISFYDHNRVSRRIDGYIGNESEYQGFKTLILYFQLSLNICTSKVKRVVEYLMRKSNRYRPSSISICTLFFNNSENSLIHPKQSVKSRQQVCKIIDEYYQEYASINEKYSETISTLFPKIDLYARTQHPTQKDLCVIFHDNREIKFDNQILSKVKKIKGSFILINVDKRNQEVKIVDGRDYINKLSSEEEQ